MISTLLTARGYVREPSAEENSELRKRAELNRHLAFDHDRKMSERMKVRGPQINKLAKRKRDLLIAAVRKIGKELDLSLTRVEDSRGIFSGWAYRSFEDDELERIRRIILIAQVIWDIEFRSEFCIGPVVSNYKAIVEEQAEAYAERWLASERYNELLKRGPFRGNESETREGWKTAIEKALNRERSAIEREKEAMKALANTEAATIIPQNLRHFHNFSEREWRTAYLKTFRARSERWLYESTRHVGGRVECF